MRDEVRNVLTSTRIVDRELEIASLFPAAEALAKRIVEAKGRWLTHSDAQLIPIFRVLDAIGEHPPAPRTPMSLAELIGEEAVAELERELVEFLESIPRRYNVYFRLPRLPDLGSDRIEIAQDIEFVSVQQEEEYADLQVRPSGPHALVNALLSKPFAAGSTHLRVAGRGYFSGRHDSSACVDALIKLKQLLALSVAGGQLSRVARWIGDDFTGGAVAVDVAANRPAWLRLPTSFSRTLEMLWIDQGIFNYPLGLIGMAMGQNDAQPPAPRPRPREEWPGQVLQRFERIGNVMGRRQNDPDTEALRTAAEWAFDSWAEDNETLAFLFTAIGLEAILQGEQNETSDTSARLADRIAYLLGRTRKQRSNLQRDFRHFYRVRKQLVHGRSSRLGPDESRWLNWGREVLRDVISHELRNVELTQERGA